MLENQTEKAFAEHLMQHLPVSTFVLDTRHRVMMWNRACEQLTGLKAEEMIGTDPHWRGFYPELRPLTAMPGGVYSTRVYDDQLNGAEALIRKIIAENG